MNFHAVMAVFFLTTLVGCGDDIARKQTSKETGGVERKTPAVTAETLIGSQMHRLRGITVLSYTEEIDQTLKNALPSGYKPIPDLRLDDEGTNTQNVITMISIGRPGVPCGLGDTFSGIDARIADCEAKNPGKNLWSGPVNGAAGEGTWKLVAFSEAKKEIWTDLRTGMVWSDVVASGNWCKASGNKQTAVEANSLVDCKSLSEDTSFCHGQNIEGVAANMRWRLPTRNDYLQADLDGIRFVMPKSNTTSGAWTATVQAASTEREHAWVYQFNDGTLTPELMTSSQHVRCIGVPVR